MSPIIGIVSKAFLVRAVCRSVETVSGRTIGWSTGRYANPATVLSKSVSTNLSDVIGPSPGAKFSTTTAPALAASAASSFSSTATTTKTGSHPPSTSALTVRARKVLPASSSRPFGSPILLDEPALGMTPAKRSGAVKLGALLTVIVRERKVGWVSVQRFGYEVGGLYGAHQPL